MRPENSNITYPFEDSASGYEISKAIRSAIVYVDLVKGSSKFSRVIGARLIEYTYTTLTFEVGSSLYGFKETVYVDVASKTGSSEHCVIKVECDSISDLDIVRLPSDIWLRLECIVPRYIQDVTMFGSTDIVLNNGYNVDVEYSDGNLYIDASPGKGLGRYSLNEIHPELSHGIRSVNGINVNHNVDIQLSDSVASLVDLKIFEPGESE